MYVILQSSENTKGTNPKNLGECSLFSDPKN